jgi:cell division protein FtsB
MPRANKSPKQRELAVKRRKKVLLAAGLSLLFYLVLSFFFGEKGFFRYMKLHRQKAALTAEISALKSSNEELRKEVDSLKTDPDSIEQLAREQGLAKDGEIIYQYEDGR